MLKIVKYCFLFLVDFSIMECTVQKSCFSPLAQSSSQASGSCCFGECAIESQVYD